MIDASTDADGFTITMRSAGRIGSISVNPESLVNGDTTNYNFKIVPDADIARGDKLYITFPFEVSLPLSYYISCRGDYQVSVSSCVKSDDQKLIITFSSVSGNYQSWQEFNIYIDNVINPVSLKPSSPFSNVRLVSSSGFEIAKYEDSRFHV